MQVIEVLEHATRQYLIHVVSEDKLCVWHDLFVVWV